MSIDPGREPIKHLSHSLLIIGMLFVSSCMSITWDITLKPEINVASTDIGKGRAVRLKTVDERASPVMGKHHDPLALSFGGYAIYTSKGAREVVETALLDGLDRKSTRLNSSHIQKSRMPSSA